MRPEEVGFFGLPPLVPFLADVFALAEDRAEPAKRPRLISISALQDGQIVCMPKNLTVKKPNSKLKTPTVLGAAGAGILAGLKLAAKNRVNQGLVGFGFSVEQVNVGGAG